MDNNPSVLVKQDYGDIQFHFQEIMEKRKMNRNQLAARANIRFEVADRFYRGAIERLDIDVLARVCYVLDCNVGDVMNYVKPKASK